MGLVFTVAVGISTGVVAMVSRLFGEGKQEEAWVVAWQALFMSLVAGVLATAVGIPLARPALVLLGAKGEVLVMGAGYLQVMAIGAGTIFVTFAMNSSLRGAGDTVTPMTAMILGTVVNLVLDPILIFGWLGCPALGVTGSAVATVIAQCVAMAFVFFRLFSGRVPIRLSLSKARIDVSLSWRLFRIGAFGSVQMWVRNIATLAVIRVVTPFGDGVLAAFGIGIRLLMVVLLPGFGIGNAAATVVGQNLGAGQPERAVKAGWGASMFYLAIVACFSILFASMPRSIVAVFNDDPEVVAAGASLLCWFALSFPFVAFGLILARAMFGAGDTFSPMWITALCLLGIQVPGAIVLSRYLGYDGIWLSIAAANSFNGILMALWYRRGRWLKKKVW
jgi:putative MATE family efflux protein